MRSYERIADLPVLIDDYEFEVSERETSSDFTRTTTVIAVRGAGETGYGEDVTYESDDHRRFVANPTVPPTGEYTHREYSETLGELEIAASQPQYRRWGLESAVLDLALKQAGTTLAGALDRTYEPVRFVASTRLGEPPSIDRVETLLEHNPDLEFKLDPISDWSLDLIERLVAMGRVRILDLKGHYEGTTVDQSPDRTLYRRIVERFPNAIIEDPVLTEETTSLFEDHTERLSWDAPIHGIEDIKALPVEPSVLNIKPSRFGSVGSLLDTIDYCQNRGIELYGGGQFELAVGREHIHAIASLFYPDGYNDVAPTAYNAPEIADDLPQSPLNPPSDARGLHW